MQIWKPHSLANPHTDQIDLQLGDTVRATADLPSDDDVRVPVGTDGRVILANGFNWQRYRILFDNGVELGDLDHRHLEATGRAARRLAKAAKKAARA